MKCKPGSQFLEVMRLLQQLWEAHQTGRVLRTEELRASLRLPLEECELMLERFVAAGWVASALNDGWVLARDADEIQMADVYREFVFHDQQTEGGFESALARLTGEAHDALSMTLQSVFTAPAERRKRAA